MARTKKTETEKQLSIAELQAMAANVNAALNEALENSTMEELAEEANETLEEAALRKKEKPKYDKAAELLEKRMLELEAVMYINGLSTTTKKYLDKLGVNMKSNHTLDQIKQILSEHKDDIEEVAISLDRDMSLATIKSLDISNSDVKSLTRQFYNKQSERKKQYARLLADIKCKLDDNLQLTEPSLGMDASILEYMDILKTEKSKVKIIEYVIKDIPICQWMQSITGIGPLHAAAMYTYIDIHKAPTVGHIWSYAGWDVGYRRKQKGQVINWNPEFRTRCYLISDNFVRAKSRKSDFYGKIYQAKKDEYIKRNENGGFAEKAAKELEILKDKNSVSAKTYATGKIPAAQIEYMARRYAVKMFLAHLHEVWYELEFNQEPPKPYPIVHMGHAHIVKCPNREVVGLAERKYLN